MKINMPISYYYILQQLPIEVPYNLFYYTMEWEFLKAANIFSMDKVNHRLENKPDNTLCSFLCPKIIHNVHNFLINS